MDRSRILCFLLLLLLSRQADSAETDDIVTWGVATTITSTAASLSHVYFATGSGIYRYAKAERRWEVPLSGSSAPPGAPAEQIWVDRFDQTLYARTIEGLFECDLVFKSWYPINDLPQIDLAYRPASIPNNLFPPTGFAYFGSGELVDDRSRRLLMSSSIDDGTGTVWFGIRGLGPARVDAASGTVELLTTGLLQNRIAAASRDDTVLWLGGESFGTGQAGVSEFDLASGRSRFLEAEREPSFPLLDVTTLAHSPAALLVGSTTGLYLVNKGDMRVSDRLDDRRGLPEREILSLWTRGDSLLVGTSGGLTLYTNQLDSIRQVYPSRFGGGPVYCIRPDGDYLWLGTDQGAFRLSLRTNELQLLTDSGASLFGGVIDIATSEPFIWLAGRRSLVRLSRTTGEFRVVNAISSRLQLRSVAAVDSLAVIATGEGITFVRQKGKQFVLTEFSERDGLASDDCRTLLFQGEYLWVGTARGLSRLWHARRGLLN